MKILIIANKFPYPENDGGAIATMGMVRGFYKAGHDVTLLGMNTYKHFVDLDEIPREIKRLARYYAVDVDIKINPWEIIRNLLFSEEPYHVERFTSDRFAEQLRRLLTMEVEAFDLIQLEGLYLCPYIPVIRKHAGEVPIVLRAHNVEHEIWERQASQARGSLRRYYLEVTAQRIKAYESQQMANPELQAVIPISDRDAKKLKKMGAGSKPMHVSTAAFDISRLDALPPVKEEARSIFYIGALDWTPNQEGMRWFLKKVWPSIHKMYPDVNLYIAGRRMPEYFESLKSEGIVVLGEVKDAYVYMRSKGIMIVPLLSGSGMRVKIIEGMAMGRAIVASSVAIEGIPARHSYDYMRADTPEEFINHLATLIEHPGMARAIGTHARELIKTRFNSEQIIEDLLAFYQKTFFKSPGTSSKPQPPAKKEESPPEAELPDGLDFDALFGKDFDF